MVDTSFVVEALLPAQTHHPAARAYLDRLADAGTIVVFNELLEIELAEVAYQIALKERHPKNWKRYRHDGRARRRANRLLTDVLSAWAQVLTAFDHARFALSDVKTQVPRLMTAHGLASYDAVHAATAAVAGVSAIVTTDAGFASLPARVELYVDASRVGPCRRFRP